MTNIFAFKSESIVRLKVYNYGGYQLQMNSVEIKNLDSEPNNTYQNSIETKADETIKRIQN